jgi:hypothetical protein
MSTNMTKLPEITSVAGKREICLFHHISNNWLMKIYHIAVHKNLHVGGIFYPGEPPFVIVDTCTSDS